MDLPIYEQLDKILQKIQSNKISIIKSPTGTGKSTLIPYFLSKDNSVAVIQPRRLAVISLYKTLKENVIDLPKIKTTIGYKMRFKSENPTANLMFFTDGMFLHEKRNFDIVIIDEIHERTVRMDMILAIYNHTHKLILMSATVDSTPITNFFPEHSLITVDGKIHDMQIFYEDQPIADYINEAFLKVKSILRTSPKSDILVFLPGEEDINELYFLLKGILNILVLKVHSQMNDDSQQKIFARSTLTKIILSTNLCETSLTIPNIGFVIDTGLFKTKTILIKNEFVFNALVINEISKDSADQRAGRSNRCGPGIVYRLYTKSKFECLKRTQPEICRSSAVDFLLFLVDKNFDVFDLKLVSYPFREVVENAVLFLFEMKFLKFCKTEKEKNNENFVGKNIKIKKSKASDFVDKIKLFENDKNLEVLKNLGVLKKNQQKEEKKCDKRIVITTLGKTILKYPFPVHISNFYHLCLKKGLYEKGAILASFLSIENQLLVPKEAKNDIKYLLGLFENGCSDFKQNFLLKKVKIVYEKLKEYENFGKFDDNSVHDFNIERVFSEAFSYNLGIRQSDGSYLHEKSGLRFFARSREKRIVFDELVCFSRNYARVCGKYFGN